MSELQTLMDDLVEGFDKGKYKPLKPKDKIPFKCTGCGGCCKNTEVMLSPYDVFNLAINLKMNPKDVFEKYLTVHRGHSSHLPVYMLKGAKAGWCDFRAEDGKCTVHKFKPKICRLFPLGAMHRYDKLGKSEGENLIFLPNQDTPGIGNGIQTVEEFTRGLKLEEYKNSATDYQQKMAERTMVYDLSKMSNIQFMYLLNIQLILPEQLFAKEGIANVKADTIMASVSAVMDKYINSICSKKVKGS